MEQKDSTTRTKKLASASELRGKKSGMSGSRKGSKKMWLSLLSLVVVLGLAIGAYYLSGVIKPEEKPTDTNYESTTVKVVDRDQKDIASITLETGDAEPFTVLSKATTTGEGDKVSTSYTYSIEGKPEFKLNQQSANSIIGYAANMTATSQVAEGVTDFAPYGLDKPALRATMRYRDGSEVVWRFGNKVPTDTDYYICQEGTNTVFTIYASAYTQMSSELNSLYVLQMPATIADPAAVKHLLIEQKGKETIEVGYLDSGEESISINTLRLMQPIEYDAHSERVSELFTSVQALTITGYAGQLSELPDAGLEEPRAEITFNDDQGTTVFFRVGNFYGNDQVYVQVDDSETVYLTSAESLSFLDTVDVGHLVDQFANLVNIQKVDAIAMKAGDQQYDVTITREPVYDAAGNPEKDTNGKPKTSDTYTYNGEVTDESLFKKLYQEIIGTLNSKVSDDRAIDGKVALSVHYTLNTAPGEFTVEYLEYDDDYYAVRRDGLTLFLIKHDKVDHLIECLQQYAEGTFVATK